MPTIYGGGVSRHHASPSQPWFRAGRFDIGTTEAVTIAAAVSLVLIAIVPLLWRVLALTQCHPFLLQLLCGEVVALKNEQAPDVRRLASVEDVETAAEGVGEQLRAEGGAADADEEDVAEALAVGGRDGPDVEVGGEGLDLRTLATGHAGVEAAVGLGQRARRQGRQRAQLGAAHQRGQVGGEPAQGVVRILHQMLERGLVERAQLGRERRPLGAPRRQAGLEGGRAPQGVVAGEQGLQFEEAVAVVHFGGRAHRLRAPAEQR